MIDTYFMEFYVKRKHNQLLHNYFNISKSCISRWKKINIIPKKHLKFFLTQEGTLDTNELLNRIYNNEKIEFI